MISKVDNPGRKKVYLKLLNFAFRGRAIVINGFVIRNHGLAETLSIKRNLVSKAVAILSVTVRNNHHFLD